MLVNITEIYNFKANKGSINVPTQFCLGSISNGFGAVECREISSKRNANDFSVDYNDIDKPDILNNPKYLIFKNNMK